MKTRVRRKSSLRGATTRKATLDTKPIYANRVQAAPPNLPVITAELCALLAKMLPNPLTPEEF